MTEHCAMYPVDTIKTRMQALAHPGQQVQLPPCANLRQGFNQGRGSHSCAACAVQLRGSSMERAVRAVLRREGWRGLYGGVGAVALGAGCAPACRLPLRHVLTCYSTVPAHCPCCCQVPEHLLP